MQKVREKGADRAFVIMVYIVLALLAIMTIYPFINIIAQAFSGYIPNVQGKVFLLPIEFQTGTFKRVVLSTKYLQSALISLRVTLIGTVLSLICTSFAAYPLSRRRLRGRRFLTAAFVFTMMFSGGIVPTYILMRNLKLLNSIWAMILPALSVYNMLVLKSNFESIPQSLEESAQIDGASDFRMFLRIMVPVSIPTYAAITLFISVGYWNSYQSAVLYITKAHLKPLQMYLVDVINYAADPLKNLDSTMMEMDSPGGVQACAILAATVPVLLVYPFFQRYFVKGIMIGSVKE